MGFLPVRNVLLVKRYKKSYLVDILFTLPTFYPTLSVGLYEPFLDVPGGLEGYGAYHCSAPLACAEILLELDQRLPRSDWPSVSH